MTWEVEHIGPHRLIRGDCREVVPTLEGVDAVITDPPYGQNYASSYIHAKTTAHWMRQRIAGDDSEEARSVLDTLFPCDYAIFGHAGNTPPPAMHTMLIWDKGPASGMGNLQIPWKKSYELIFIGGQGWQGSRDESVLKGHWIVTRASMGRLHPNEKPVSLLVYLISKHRGKTVLDPFMGSGTTGVACVQLGRIFTGIEIERQYFDSACQRLHDALAQPDLFIAQAPRAIQQPLFAGGR